MHEEKKQYGGERGEKGKAENNLFILSLPLSFFFFFFFEKAKLCTLVAQGDCTDTHNMKKIHSQKKEKRKSTQKKKNWGETLLRFFFSLAPKWGRGGGNQNISRFTSLMVPKIPLLYYKKGTGRATSTKLFFVLHHQRRGGWTF